MSLSKEKREAAKYYLLEQIASGNPSYVQKTADVFEITRAAVYGYLREMEKQEIVRKSGKRYALNEEVYQFAYARTKELEETEIYVKDIQGILLGLDDNIQSIWEYAISEMLNNAIDHSTAKKIHIVVSKTYLYTTVSIWDDGIGIFEKIKGYYHYDSLDTAIMELFKGKLTTDTENHSGEGIFFTSRVMDVFGAFSDGKLFSHNNYSDVIKSFNEEKTPAKGTLIFMRLSNFSKKVLRDIFDAYADVDGGFTKTSIPLNHIYPNGYPISRSQAKRLTHRFDDFEEIELDFQGIRDVGQGFAHEIFVVFQKKHPEIKITATNASKAVEKMLHHVLAT
jgi:anti-sigma regulatory factor (Ser/Thr protein kinase)